MKEFFLMKKLFPVLLLGILPLLNGSETVTYRSAPGVPMECSSTLQKLEHFLNDLFPKSLYRKTPLTIDITTPKHKLPPVSEKLLEIPGAALETLSLEALSAAGGAMLYAHGKAPAKFRLPLFLCAAFRHRERSLKQEGRFLGSCRQLNSVKLFLNVDAMPPLRELLSVTAPDRDPAAAFWFDDHARLLFELLRRRGVRGSAAEYEKEATKLLADETLKEEISRHFWNRFQTRPPQLIRKKLDTLMQIQLPRLDHNGEENGLFETVSVTLMPSKLRHHPRRKELFRRYSALVLSLSPRCPGSMRNSLRAFHDSAAALGNKSAPELEAKFLQALADVEQAFQLCLSRSQALDEAALRLENPTVLLRRSLLENSRPGSAASPEAGRFLQRWNEYYNSN